MRSSLLCHASRRSEVGAALLAFLLGLGVPCWSQQVLTFGTPKVELLHSAGPSTQKIDITILGEGYTTAQLQGVYKDHVATFVDYLLTSTPFAHYKGAVNVRKFNIVSNQEGLDRPDQGVFVTTAFDAEYNINAPGHIVFKDLDNVSEAFATLDDSGLPVDSDAAIVLINSTLYGGLGSHSTGSLVFSSATAYCPEIPVHEFAHSFAHNITNLADEHLGSQTYTGPEPNTPNLTINTTSSSKWARHVGIEYVDFFPGGLVYYNAGVYRPTYSYCIMQKICDWTPTPSFCRVCRIDAFLPTIEARSAWTDIINPSANNEACSAVAIDSKHRNDTYSDGKVVWETTGNQGSYTGQPNAIAVDASGLCIAGWQYTPGRVWHVVRRKSTDGTLLWEQSLPQTFAVDDAAYGTAADSSGVYTVGKYGSSNVWRVEKRDLQTGQLIWDQGPYYGHHGKASAVVATRTNLYVVGQSYSDWKWRIERRDKTTGYFTNTFHSVSGTALSVAANNTHLYVLGTELSAGNYQWTLEERNLSDLAFVRSRQYALSAYDDIPSGIALDKKGVFMVGTKGSSSGPQWHVIRADLSYFPSYSQRNLGSGAANSVSLGLSGWYVAGTANGQPNLQQLDISGTPEICWNNGQTCWSGSSPMQSAVPYAIAAHGTGIYIAAQDNSTAKWRVQKRIAPELAERGVYVAGLDYSAGAYRWKTTKLNILDASKIWESTGSSTDSSARPMSIAVDSTGVYVAGIWNSIGMSFFYSQKLDLKSGAVLWGGVSTGLGTASGIAVDTSSVYVAGSEYGAGDFQQWRIENRNKQTGALNWTKTSAVANRHLVANGIAVDATAIYVVGTNTGISGIRGWRIEKRQLNGNHFVPSQIVSEGEGLNDAEAFGIATDDSAIYIAGTTPFNSQSMWRVNKRSKTNLSILWDKQYNPTTTGTDKALSLAVDAPRQVVYVAGFEHSATGNKWHVQKFSTASGAELGTAVISGSVGGEALGISADLSGAYAVGFDTAPGNQQWRIEKLSHFE